MICEKFDYVDRGYVNMKEPERRKHLTCGNCGQCDFDTKLGHSCKESGELL